MGLRGLVLAAGVGSRLRGLLGVEKVLARVGGLRLVCYPLAAMWYAGVSEVYVVTRRGLVGLLGEAVRECPGPSVARVVETARWWAGSGWTLLDGLAHLESGDVVVSVADHIYEPRLVERLVEGCRAPYCLAGDSRAELVDVGEATKVRAGAGGLVEDIGKGVAPYTHVDAGVHFFRYNIVPHRCVSPRLSLNDVKRCLASMGVLQLVDVTGVKWIDVDTPEEYGKVVGGDAARLAELVAGLWG